MAIGDTFPGGITESRDPVTGRTVRQLAAGDGNDYHIYYQAYGITRDGRWLAFFSERDRTTQLYRLDLQTGESTQLTAGRTPNSGWWPWNQIDTTGIYAFIGCLNPVTSDVFYYQDDEMRAANLDTLEDRLVVKTPPGMRPLAQPACAYDGSFVATAYANKEEVLRSEASHREMQALGRSTSDAELNWRKVIKSRLDAVDLQTGEVTTLLDDIEAQLHNMVIAADNDTILLVTPPEKVGGLLSVKRSQPGAWDIVALPQEYGGICHFHSTTNGWITFESNVRAEDAPRTWSGPGTYGTYQGRMRADGSECRAWWLGNQGYVHTGYDLTSEFPFAELFCGGDQHQLAAIRPQDDGTAKLIRLTGNLPPGGDQRHHAHPILTPDRRRIVYTATGDDGFCHIYDVDVCDLTGA